MKLETPKSSTLPLASSAENAAATSSGSMSGSWRCRRSSSTWSVPEGLQAALRGVDDVRAAGVIAVPAGAAGRRSETSLMLHLVMSVSSSAQARVGAQGGPEGLLHGVAAVDVRQVDGVDPEAQDLACIQAASAAPSRPHSGCRQRPAMMLESSMGRAGDDNRRGSVPAAAVPLVRPEPLASPSMDPSEPRTADDDAARSSQTSAPAAPAGTGSGASIAAALAAARRARRRAGGALPARARAWTRAGCRRTTGSSSGRRRSIKIDLATAGRERLAGGGPGAGARTSSGDFSQDEGRSTYPHGYLHQLSTRYAARLGAQRRASDAWRPCGLDQAVFGAR